MFKEQGHLNSGHMFILDTQMPQISYKTILPSVRQPVDKPKLELTLSVLDLGEAKLKCGWSEWLR